MPCTTVRSRRAGATSALLTLLLAALPACAAVHRPATTVPALLADADTARTAERALRDTVVARLARRVAAKPDRTLDILMLSGGGQNGAFGIGFLRGWRERTDAPMPRFDLVTGISTGALQAPFALLGTGPALDTIASIYRNSADRIAPSIDWLFWLRRTGGLVNTTRYDASIRTVVDDVLRDSLRRAFAEDRQAVFGTTDMDLAIGRAWDLATSLGVRGDSGLVRTRSLLKAASAIPGIFPPVVVDGHVHSDGGIVNNFLPLLTLDDYRAMLARVRSAGITDPVTVRVWVIVNGWTHAAPVVMDPASRKQIKGRWSGVMFFSYHPLLLQGLENLAHAASGELPGLRMQVRYTAIPAEVATDPQASTLFNKQFMQRLEEMGLARARSASPWNGPISAYERPAAARP